jgi:hypothetical protein
MPRDGAAVVSFDPGWYMERRPIDEALCIVADRDDASAQSLLTCRAPPAAAL